MHRVRASAGFMLVGVLALATAGVRPVSAQTPPNVWFEDSFCSGTLANWTASPLGLQSNWNASSGRAVYNGGGHTQLYAGTMAWTDYTVEACSLKD